MRQWRLITDSPTSGALNMARDEAILNAVSNGNQLPTLRLYAWQPFCLSLGYGQNSADADPERLSAAGWGLVRRPTGGRAILHGDELTYSISLPIDDDLAQGDVISSYRRLSEGLMAALQHLGLAAQSEKHQDGTRFMGPVCFEVPSHYEITVMGKKLIGSAQVRRKDGILQHGTLPLQGDIARICAALRYDDEAARAEARLKVRAHALTLADIFGMTTTWEQAAQAFIVGFQAVFAIEFIPAELSASEAQDAERLYHDLYANPLHTHKR